MVIKRRLTTAEFIEQMQQADDGDRVVELISGEIVEMPSNLYSSAIAGIIIHLLNAFVRPRRLGFVTGEAGGYTIDDENLYAPDVAFISRARQAALPLEGFGPIPPDLAVEVVSPSDLKDVKQRIEYKLARYLAAGVPLVWMVYPERREVEVHRPGQPMTTVGIDGALDGGDVLPGLTIAVRDIFEME
jgi:Uma2 family endonuclease